MPRDYIGRCRPNWALEMAIYSLTGNARSPFRAEPAQTTIQIITIWNASGAQTQDVSFDLVDIQRIIIPTRFSGRFRNAFKTYDDEVVFAD